jgi:broad specificity phosphatase PhoE
MKIILIRHGETTGDVEGRYGGAYDDHLTERGREQLQTTAEQLRGESVDVIFTSPLIRAQESTAIINEVLQTKVQILPDLRERDYGVLGGLTKAEASEQYPEAVEAHKNPDNTDPAGEPRADFITRVEQALRFIQVQSLESVIVLAHGGSLKVILQALQQPIPDSIGDGEIIYVTRYI